MKTSNLTEISIVSEILDSQFALPNFTSDSYLKLSHRLDSELKSLSRKALDDGLASIYFKLDSEISVIWPFVRMGNVTSFDLLRLDELVLFHIYRKLRNRFSTAIDLGANLGLHSIIFDKLGYLVTAIEPDPTHFLHLLQNLSQNNSLVREIRRAAVGNATGSSAFVRVLDNSTSSHLLSSMKNAYGPIETFEVEVITLHTLLKPEIPSLIKVDIEGAEFSVIETLEHGDWESLELIVEVSNAYSAHEILKYVQKYNLNAYSQCTDWAVVKRIEQMPTCYKQGSLAITAKSFPIFG